MANPLFNRAQGAQMGGMQAGINPQAIQGIMQMINRGADLKDVVKAFKKSGMTPQLAEQALCTAFPQLKQIKGQMKQMQQSGMSQQDMFAGFAKQANVDASELNKTYDSLMRLVK